MRIDSQSTNTLTKANVQVNTQTNAAKNTGAVKESLLGRAEGSEGIQEMDHKPQNELSMSDKQWIDMINKANKALEGPYTIAEYSVHDETNVIMVKIIDKETHKVLKEFPPEKILDMAAKMWEIAGIIVDERR